MKPFADIELLGVPSLAVRRQQFAARLHRFGGGGGAPMRNLYNETADELKAKADLAPRVFATEAQFGPQYNALDLQNIQDTLYGYSGGSRDVTSTETQNGWINSATGEFTTIDPGSGNASHGGYGGGGRRNHGQGITAGTWTPYSRQVQRTNTVNTPATRGLLDIYGDVADRSAAIEARGLSTQRAADIADVKRLGPASLEAIKAADPATAALIDRYTTQADQELALGGRLSPEQLRQIKNQTMGSAYNRGWGFNPGDLARTAMETTDYASNLANQRRANAAGAIGLRQSVYGDAFNRVLGRPAAANIQGYTGAAQGITRTSGPRLFGSTVNANDVYSSNQNAAAANSAADAQQTQGYVGAGVAAAGIAATIAIAA